MRQSLGQPLTWDISSGRHCWLDLTDVDGYTPRNTPYFQQLYAVTRFITYGLNQDEVLT